MKEGIEQGKKLLQSTGGKAAGKRGSSELEAIVFSSDNDVTAILEFLPPLDQIKASRMEEEEQTQWLDAYLNHLLNQMPVLKQQAIRQDPTTKGKFAKLLDYYKGLHDSKKKQKTGR